MAHSTWVTASGLVCGAGRRLLSATLVADAVGAATATLRHGTSAAGETIAVLSAVTSTQATVKFASGLLLDDGLHATLGSNITGVLVVWE